ncbi:serine protease 27-like [Salarias fasciatus]|uniref:serine protease 27-like n=1 Tax=Salarias fasciatus TaxID=181472 RepID=UPI001176F379|nr:serine protease 27-like [Salarias fasciatus]
MASHSAMCVTALLTLLVPEAETQSSVCGRASLNNRIVGGEVAPEGNWPWQVSLNRFGVQFCGGSLINEEWVLSAAHCFQGLTTARLTAHLGRQSRSGPNPNEQSRSVSQIVSHPNYSSVSQDNDIALLRLSSPATFTSSIVPVCLAAPGSAAHTGVNAWVTGWGLTSENGSFSNDLREVEVPVVGNRQCNCILGVGRITDNMLCAGLTEGGRDACQGDSGGPLVSRQGGVWVQLGIVSFGSGCANPGLPGVYTRVSRYMSWINGRITSNQPGYVTFRSAVTDSDLNVTCAGLPPPPTTSGTTVPAATPGTNNSTPATTPGTNNSTPATTPGTNNPTPATTPRTNNSTPTTTAGTNNSTPPTTPGTNDSTPATTPGTNNSTPTTTPGTNDSTPTTTPGTNDSTPATTPGTINPAPATTPGTNTTSGTPSSSTTGLSSSNTTAASSQTTASGGSSSPSTSLMAVLHLLAVSTSLQLFS